MKKVFFAQMVNTFGTAQEQRDINSLALMGFEVINPNSPELQELRKKYGQDAFDALIEDCDILAFRGTPNGDIGAGIAAQIKLAIQWDMPVIELPSMISNRQLSIEETREYLAIVGQR